MWRGIVMVALLAGCASTKAPPREVVKLEPACNRQCIVGHQACYGPARTGWDKAACNRILQECRATCPKVE